MPSGTAITLSNTPREEAVIRRFADSFEPANVGTPSRPWHATDKNEGGICRSPANDSMHAIVTIGAKKMAFRKKRYPAQPYRPKSQANGVRRSEGCLPATQPTKQGALSIHALPYARSPPQRPERSPKLLCTNGRLETFPSPQAVASVTPPWGPGRKSLGDGRRRPAGGEGLSHMARRRPGEN